MTGRNKWPPKGTRPVRPEDTDPDTAIYVSLPDHIVRAEEPHQETKETGHFRKVAHWIGRIFGRS